MFTTVSPGHAVVDYARHPGVTTLVTARTVAVCRYLADPKVSAWKIVTRDEIAELHAAGIGVLLNWEQAATDPLKGLAKGKQHAAAAEKMADELGYPDDLPIIYSIDFDVTPTTFGPALDYMRGCNAGARRPVGVYGEADVIDRVMTEGLATFGWQTRAWSRGRRSVHASLLQMAGRIPNTDHNEVLKPFRAWLPKPVVVEPTPTPADPAPLTPGDDPMKLIQAVDVIDDKFEVDDAVFLVTGGTARWMQTGFDVAAAAGEGAELGPDGTPLKWDRQRLAWLHRLGPLPTYDKSASPARTDAGSFRTQG